MKNYANTYSLSDFQHFPHQCLNIFATRVEVFPCLEVKKVKHSSKIGQRRRTMKFQ